MKTLFCSLTLLIATSAAFAEWRTETYSLRAGWNAIYPTVDATHTTLNDLLAANPNIIEVWRWQPERVDNRLPGQVNAPAIGEEWSIWKRGVPEETTFSHLASNYGYLVRLVDGAAQQTLSVKGRAVIPEVRWRNDGLQLVGFPVVTSGTRPTFSGYLAPTGFALNSSSILRYNGGPIVNGVNPTAVVPSSNRIERGQAYWARITNFSRYYGPLTVELSAGNTIAFGDKASAVKIVFKNVSSGSLTFTLTPQASDTAPIGHTSIAGSVPLKIKVDPEIAYTGFSGVRTMTLAAGVSLGVNVVVNRDLITAPLGSHLGSLLKVTTTAGIAGEELYLPVTADVSALAGLWLGEATVDQVASVAKQYQRDAAGNTLYETNAANPNFGKPAEVLPTLTTPSAATTLPSVHRSYALRLIVHVDSAGQARLLSHVYSGKLAAANPSSPTGLVTDESLLDPSSLKTAVRLSVAHLPLDLVSGISSNFNARTFSGTFTKGSLLSGLTLTTGYNASDNPFVHAYHPDHDNLDARFATTLPAGVEAFNVSREFNLKIDTAAPADAGTEWGTTTLTGLYSERITGPHKDALRAQGSFVLRKVSDIQVITTH